MNVYGIMRLYGSARSCNKPLARQDMQPIELLTGETPDISEYLDFSFYDWVIFKTNVIIGDTEIGQYLGVLHSFGNLMTYVVIDKMQR